MSTVVEAGTEYEAVPRDSTPAEFIIATSRRPATAPDPTEQDEVMLTLPSAEREEEDREADAPQLVVRPAPRPAAWRSVSRTFELLQQWEGTVLTVEDGEFTARLADLTVLNNPLEEATFSVRDVSPCDRPLLESGAVFYWSIGYEITEYGMHRRVSTIRFRRLPAWTRHDVESARREAEGLSWMLETDDATEPTAGS